MSLDLTLKNREFKFNVANLGQHKVYVFEDFRLDAVHKLLYRKDAQISLTPKAVETLIALVERRGEVVAKDELMEVIWAGTIVEESNLAQYLHVLRKTLGETSDGKPYIETLKRRGYRFNGSVQVVKNGSSQSTSSEHTEHPDHETARISNPARPVPNRAERHGSLAKAKFPDELHEPLTSVNVERSGNIYSVSDWRRGPVADRSLTTERQSRSKWVFPLVVLALVAGSSAIVFGIFKFTSGRQSIANQSIPFLGSDMTRLTTTGRSKRGAAISPDGKYVAHILSGSDGESLWVRQVNVANDIRIAGTVNIDIVWVTFAPDGNFVYYLSLPRDKGETELFRVPVLGGPTLKIADNVGAPTLSPDGSQMAYMKMFGEETRLFVANFDGTNPVEIVSRHEPDYLNMFWFAPAWSLDGRNIAFSANQSDENGRYEALLAVDVETRAERKLTDARWQQVGQSRWLADGLVVAAAETSTGPKQLWHISLTDGAATRITRDLNDYVNLSLTSDAKTLAVIQNNSVSNIWTLSEGSPTPKQLRSEAGTFNEIIWLPDGRLAYTSNAGGSSEIWTMNADGTDVRQITTGANARLGLAITPDEKQLIFAAERDGKYNLWRIAIDGSNLTRITNGEGEYYPQCTPDGRWIVFQSGGNYPTLWKMPLVGGDPIKITKTKASRPSVSPDGKYVAYHYLDSSSEGLRWGVGINNIETGERIQRFDFPPSVVERLVKWTRDGRSIAFLNSPNGVPNIWLQPLDGRPATPLTDFASDNIIAFNWNADGRQLAVIRGVETSDVVLINRSPSK